MIKVLDHGYVKLVEPKGIWGSDEAIIEAARMSTNKGFQKWGPLENCKHCGAHTNSENLYTSNTCIKTEHDFAGDEKLLRYLWEHKHHTPFEMAGMVIEVQAPIMVFREWHRHRTQSYNEMSGRYTELPNLYYLPAESRIQKQAKHNKQSSEGSFSPDEAAHIRLLMLSATEDCRKAYETMLEMGVAREIARLVLPVNQYSRMRASANLRNWLGFLTLRMAPNAQWEIREYANAVATLVEAQFPRTYALFREGYDQTITS